MKTKKNILFINTTFKTGGPSTVILAICKNLIDRYNIFIASENDEKDNTRSNIENVDKTSIIKGGSKSNHLNLILGLRRLLQSKCYNSIIVSKNKYTRYFVCLKILGVLPKRNKMTYYVHAGSSELRYFYNNLDLWLLLFTYGKFIFLHDDYSDNIMRPYNTFKRRVIDMLIPKPSHKCFLSKAKFIPNPDYYALRHKDRSFNKQIVVAARLDKNKNVVELIEALNIISSDLDSWHCVVLGEGDELINLKNKVESLGLNNLIHFKGNVNNVSQYYCSSSIYVSTSEFEGFGMSILEAMSHSLAIISSSTCGGKYLLRGGVDGILYEYGDTMMLADKLRMLIKNQDIRYHYGHLSSKRVGQFSLDKIVSEWINFLN